eukprot:CAMPEP_0185609010 /NCGR_PEP_ID=MMETSP0436-20130131/9262_1 /TAXON_ID=626734 ORGANISM="Favella taraikaensis, Strain Fe Narragansett Bay" /NCGR_SAMPLE_ID=MMETSP0436 /ASSEMBLY_ACC=CAM_ASM_000390 /LENGTH=57 /DNA_ID=CAMNT_0028241333 /DNA_START=133 /DNA_END=303 /DNA_ORIENTATION=+
MIGQKVAATRVLGGESSHIVDFAIDAEPAVLWRIVLGDLLCADLSQLTSCCCLRHFP